jgi:hypothetical protein
MCEVEVRSFVSWDKFDELRHFFERNAQFLGADEKEKTKNYLKKKIEALGVETIPRDVFENLRITQKTGGIAK